MPEPVEKKVASQIGAAWYRLRDFRQQCDHYSKIGATASQSVAVDGRPDGLLSWR